MSTVLIAVACASGDAEPVGVLETVHLVPGDGWDTSRTLEEIAADELVPHNDVIAERFAQGALLANALRADGGGFYLYDAAVVDRSELIATDPAYTTELLIPIQQSTWSLRYENLGASLQGHGVYIVDVVGPVGADHLDYWDGLADAGALLAGGTVGDRDVRYLLRASDPSEADRIVADDPEAPSATVVAWGNPEPFPAFFHRRSLAATQEVQP